MGGMTPQEALQLLGLSPDSDQSDLTKAFHDLSQRHHPDKPDGDGKRQARLNEAREVAAAYIADRKALVPLQLQRTVHELERSLAAETAARRASEIATSGKRRRIRPLQAIKYGALLCAAFAGAIGWFGDNLLPRFISSLTGPAIDPNPFREEFKMLAIWLGAAAGILQFLVQRHSFLVETYTEQLSDGEFCARELARALDYTSKKEVEEAEISTDWQSGFFPFDQILGLDPTDRRRVLILKSVEHGLLESIRDSTKPYKRSYKTNYRLGEFRPPEASPRPPPPPMTMREAAMGFGVAVTLSCIFGAAALYFYTNGSGWMYIPGFFALVALVWMVIFELEFLRAVKRSRKEREQKAERSED